MFHPTSTVPSIRSPHSLPGSISVCVISFYSYAINASTMILLLIQSVSLVSRIFFLVCFICFTMVALIRHHYPPVLVRLSPSCRPPGLSGCAIVRSDVSAMPAYPTNDAAPYRLRCSLEWPYQWAPTYRCDRNPPQLPPDSLSANGRWVGFFDLVVRGRRK